MSNGVPTNYCVPIRRARVRFKAQTDRANSSSRHVILPTSNSTYACPMLFLYVDYELNEMGHSTAIQPRQTI